MTKRGLPEQDSSFKCFRVQWTLMHAYEQFEQIIVSADRAVGAQSKIRDSGFNDNARHNYAAPGFATRVLGIMCRLLGKQRGNSTVDRE